MAQQYPHVEWLDLDGNNTLTEVAVLKKDQIGNTYHIKLTNLDTIDRQRLANIITSRNSPNFELWDLLSQATLGNGMNALDYFHQFVKVRTPAGQILDPSAGVIGGGVAVGTAPAPQAQATAEAAPAPAPKTTRKSAK